MNLGPIVNVFCVSSVLIVFYVSSQNNCPSGWFGDRCRFKCRCVNNNNCDQTGKCNDTLLCQPGWFGPGCQYVDMASHTTTGRTWMYDGDDNTCAYPYSATVNRTFILNTSVPFTWMRIVVKNQVQPDFENLQITLLLDAVPVTCQGMQKEFVDNRTMDVQCKNSPLFNRGDLNGTAMTLLCSIYVSGGRNVALKEVAQQTGNYSRFISNKEYYFPASLSVDGDTNSNLYQKSCSHTSGKSLWKLFFTVPRLVHTYILYNRGDHDLSRSINFTLTSFNSKNESVFAYRDNQTTGKLIYQIKHLLLPVSRIEVEYHNAEDILQMCELEVYGDSHCLNGQFGRDCEINCFCADAAACNLITGRCPSGCATGFNGSACEIGCDPGTYGEYCNATCSSTCGTPGLANATSCNISTGVCLQGCGTGFAGQFCKDACPVETYGEKCNSSCSSGCASDDTKQTSCNSITGACLKGCKSGLSGEMCQEKCPAGTFGLNCHQACSKNCAPNDTGEVLPCDHVTGACSQGCQAGFSGDSCLVQAKAPQTAESNLLILIVGLCLLIATVAFFGYCFCMKKTAQSHAEKTADSLHPELME